MKPNLRTLYAAFDVYPSAKGAATHISHAAKSLFEFGNGGILHVLGHPDLPKYQEEEDNIVIHRFFEPIPHYLDRADAYMQHLSEVLSHYKDLEFVQFRDIWSGIPILHQARTYKTIFEVNGLPSIELPYHYPELPKSTLKKIRELEDNCLAKSDGIITPAQVIKDNLIKRGVERDKITVIPNGAEPPDYLEASPVIREPYIIYFGALQAWQGIDILLKAFAGLEDYTDLKLVVCSSSRPRYIKAYRKLGEKLGLEDRVIWLHQLSKPELNLWIRQALISIAPLKETPRNIFQGCSPLKIFESLACGTAVVASDLPAVQEIVENNVHAKLVRPDRPAVLSRAIRFLLDEEEERMRLAEEGQKLVEQKYQWRSIHKRVIEYYHNFSILTENR